MPVVCEVIDDVGTEPETLDSLRILIERTADVEQTIPQGSWTVTFRLTDDATISQVHAQYFEDPSPTDVISFPSGDDLGHDRGHLGDVLISVETAAEYAVSEGHSTQREIEFLALHGLLHLCGYDDQTDDDRDAMLARQSELLRLVETTREQ